MFCVQGVASVRPRWASKRLDCRLWKARISFSTWEIFYPHHDNKEKIVMIKTSGYKGVFWIRFWHLKLVLFWQKWGLPYMGFAWKEESCLTILHPGLLRIICSPQVIDKAAISHFASSNKMMLQRTLPTKERRQ